MIGDIINSIIVTVKYNKKTSDKSVNDVCYENLPPDFINKDGTCKCMTGGDQYSEFMSYQCIGCKYSHLEK